MARKTKKMEKVEETKLDGKSLEEVLPVMMTTLGLSATAEEFGVSKATLGYWLLKLGITIVRVALVEGEAVIVRRQGNIITITPSEAPPGEPKQINDLREGVRDLRRAAAS